MKNPRTLFHQIVGILLHHLVRDLQMILPLAHRALVFHRHIDMEDQDIIILLQVLVILMTEMQVHLVRVQAKAHRALVRVHIMKTATQKKS